MHELLKHVLNERDLTRAGDIFAIPDSEIVDDLNEVVSYSCKHFADTRICRYKTILCQYNLDIRYRVCVLLSQNYPYPSYMSTLCLMSHGM